MPTVEKVSIALPAEMVSLIRQSVKTGEYASSSEAVRDALRDWAHKRATRQDGVAALRALWQQAVEDRSTGIDPEPVMRRLKAKYEAMTKAKGR
jgi:antitoxin ParD1/3/4